MRVGVELMITNISVAKVLAASRPKMIANGQR